MDNLAEKLADLSGNKHSMYSYIVGNQNFFYIQESFNRDQDVFVNASEDLYGCAKLIFNLDINYNTDETRELTRKLVSQLLIDESMQQAIDARVNTKFFDVTKKTLSVLSGIISDNTDELGLSDHDLEIVSEILGDANNIRKFSNELQKNGLDGALARFAEVCAYSGISVALNSDFLMDEVYETGVLGEAFCEACSKVGGVVDHLNTVFAAWNTSAELTSQLVTIAAAEEEARALLDMLIDYTDADTAIYKELVTIRDSIDKVSTEMSTQFITRLTASIIQSAAGDEIKAILQYVDFAYGTSLGVIYTIAKLTFGTLDYVFDWGGSIEDLHVLRVDSQISLSLGRALGKYGLSAATNEEALYTMKALKYLIKMRLIGEQSFVNIANGESEGSQTENLNWVNTTMGTSYASLDDYATSISEQLLTYRDNIFATYYVNLDIPAAPTVTVNYLTSTTNESFSDDYEYSFEGSVWHDCTDGPIAFEPGTVARRLWVRVKESSASVSGNITKIVIPAKPYIAGDVSVIYNGDSYRISGLAAGTYQYVFTNAKSAETLSETFTVKDNETVILQESADWTYLAIRTPASATSFESQVRYLVTEEPENNWMVNTEKEIVTGMPEATTAAEIEEYYAALGYTVSVTDADGQATDVVGTGCILSLNGNAYSIVVLGDVNGDAEIDIFDMYILLDYINSAASLTGAYREAGRVCGNEEIAMADFYAGLAYINSGSFSN